MNEKPLIYDLEYDQLLKILVNWGQPSYRASQIWQGLYQQLSNSPKAISTIPKELGERLENEFRFQSLTMENDRISENEDTQKALFHTHSGDRIETVLMCYHRRRTVCVSTQSGCGMGCVFCATGQMGLQRSLTSGEIVEQVLFFARQLMHQGDGLTNVVVMGMGEPFQNYEATMKAIDTLNHPEGFNFGARRFTVSTVGLVPVIERFTQEKRQVNLAVSLHAATNELRDQLVPINRRFPLERLLQSCRDYVSFTGRRITFEWALIDQINDDLDQAKKLADLVEDLLCHVNLIPLNPTAGYAQGASREETISAFQDYLRSRGISCTTRVRRGIEIQAGCGQLVAD